MTGYFLYNHIDLIKNNCTLIFKSDTKEYMCQYLCVREEPIHKNGDTMHLYVRKTPKKDVYNLYNVDGSKVGVLGVTSMLMSHQLMSLFKKIEKLRMVCQYNAYFNAWIAKKTV